jgi:gluconokinase
VSHPDAIVVMGVSGSGKSTFGAALAAAAGRAFVDADDLHPAANKTKMASGIPLDDDDRAPWLDAVAAAARKGGPVVVACSALKRSYRERLANGIPGVAFLELVVSREELTRRLAARSHEFMSPTLLDSQLATLESLAPDEPGVRMEYTNSGSLQDHLDRAAKLLSDLASRHPAVAT